MKINQSLTADSVVMDFRTKRGAGVAPSRPPLFSCRRLSGGPPSKIAIIREDLVTLTGSPFTAVVLNQLLYWTERLTDLDQLVKEELDPERSDSPRYGWFYKSSEELAEETLLGFDRRTIRRYLNDFMEKGWLSERPNPANKWDRTTQYRINIRQIYLNLREVGYELPGFPLEGFQDLQASLPELHNTSNTNTHNSHSTSQELSKCRAHSLGHSNAQLIHPTPQNPSKRRTRSEGHLNAQQWTLECHPGGHSNVIQSALFNLTETTTEITNKEHTERTLDNLKILGEEKKEQVGSSSSPNPHLAESMVKVWKRHVAGSTQLTSKRKEKLESVLERHFQNDVTLWDAFCQRIKDSPFLRGEGSKGWRVSLDWILIEENLIKVLEGNFDDTAAQKRALAKQSHEKLNQEKNDLLNTIKDPMWKAWFSSLITRPETDTDYVPHFILQDIVNVRFLEFDGRLVCFESEDPRALSRLEDIRYKILPIVKRTFPKARNIQTSLSPPTTERTESC
jgi:hypothetical protein